MTNEERRAAFQLLPGRPRRVPIDPEQFTEPASQGLLFPVPDRDLLIFVVFPFVTEDEFTQTLERAKPRAILELRRSPRFDIGHMNRQDAFRWFEAVQSKYYDFSSLLRADDQYAVDPAQLVGAFLLRSGNPVDGPVMILLSQSSLEGESEESGMLSRITRLFTSASNHPWKTVEIPQFA